MPPLRAHEAAGSGGSISRAEWRWVAGASAVVLVLASLPYAVGHLTASQSVFFGAVFDRMDFSHHLGGTWLGLRGGWGFQLLNTSDPHPVAYFRLFYPALGHLARLLYLSPLGVFHLARLACGLALLVGVYHLAALCFQPIALRRTTFLLFALGSGLGWLQLLTGAFPQPDLWPLDFWHIDGYGFFTLLTFPHLAAISWLVMTALVAGVRWLSDSRARHWLIACGALLALQTIQPFSPAIPGAALLAFLLLDCISRRRLDVSRVASFAALGMPLLPTLAYQMWFLRGDPVWRSFVQQNVTLSPPPLYYLMGYGILSPLAAWGGWWALRRQRQPHFRLALAWVAACFLLAYLPLPIQRRFTESVMIPIALLATSGLARGLLPWIRRHSRLFARWRKQGTWRRLRRQVMALCVATASISSLYLALGGALLAGSRSSDLFDPRPVVTAADWLAENSDWRTPVLSAERTGILLVGRIGHRVYLGHPIETADYRRKSAAVSAFFSPGTSDEARIDLLRGCGCRYVFYGPYEQALGGWNPSGADFLQPVFHQGTVTVFRVEP